jgi:alcohol oxidase
LTLACVAAGRLAAANPDLRILLAEQGPNNFQDPTVITPAFFGSHLVPDSTHTYVELIYEFEIHSKLHRFFSLFWTGNTSKAANDRKPIVPTGMCQVRWV